MVQSKILNQPLETRYIVVKIILDDSCFLSTGTNEIVIKDLTMEVILSHQMGFQLAQADLTIYGLSLSTIQSLSKINIYGYNVPKNQLFIYAGYTLDANGFPPLAFIGAIYNAGANLNNPDYPMKISSMSLTFDQNLTIPSSSVKGDIPIDNLLKSIVSKMQGYNYLSNGVKGSIRNPNYTGSYVAQIRNICDDYGLAMAIENDTIYVSTIGEDEGAPTLNISVDNYLIKRPQLSEFGVDIIIWYTPSIEILQKINLTSIYAIANGVWYINAIVTTLHNRGDKWESVLRLNATAQRAELKDAQ